MSSNFRRQLNQIRDLHFKRKDLEIQLPTTFSFKDHGVYDFNNVLNFFDWSIENTNVKIDLTTCTQANYQALSLLVAYAWFLRSKGCYVTVEDGGGVSDAGKMWRLMGARGFSGVATHPKSQFTGDKYKPLIAIRNYDDFKFAVESADGYTKGFNIEYTNTLRYVLSELLYNTLEHGPSFFANIEPLLRIPSLVQFAWYKNTNEIQFIIADTGIGIKEHIEQAYPGQESDEEAIKLAIKPQVSGTFGKKDPYIEKNNAGVGLFISSNIIRRLNADMYIVSGNGLLHISPRDITGKTLNNDWQGTFVLVTLKLERNTSFTLHNMMQEFREKALSEQKAGDLFEDENRFYLLITNFFGSFAEDKDAAIRFRDNRLIPEVVRGGKKLLVDFDGVSSAPHSFLSALLATPIKNLGLKAYKMIKIINASPEIRETIDFIMDENTS
ncbi:STAS-like domain-containing protein [Methylophilus glucosoxydans]|uniref:STAS-like domain-containing protein n=1 Tax=Methylophilus glucosoxydans TaxID=752553 RepID=A0ABW3GIK0_9PROT